MKAESRKFESRLSQPIAVAPQNGVLPINVSRLSGCSSIVPFSSQGHEYRKMGSDACRSVAETRLVPSITLTKLLRLMPPLYPRRGSILDSLPAACAPPLGLNPRADHRSSPCV